MPNANITQDQLQAALFATEIGNDETKLNKLSWGGRYKAAVPFGGFRMPCKSP